MNSPTLTKSFLAGAAITKYRIVKPHSADYAAVQAAAVTDLSFGICAELDIASGERGDIHLSGVAPVEYGGTVTRGDKLTSDANGKAVTAAPAAGVNNQIIGIAMVSGSSGDIGAALISPCVMQGA